MPASLEALLAFLLAGVLALLLVPLTDLLARRVGAIDFPNQRSLHEARPVLADIDSYALAAERGYSANDDVQGALVEFRVARERTVDLLSKLHADDLARTAVFEGLGPVTVRGLMHYLCSHDQLHLAGLQWLLGQIEASRPATS